MNGNFDDEEIMNDEQKRNSSSSLQYGNISSKKPSLDEYGAREKSTPGINGINDDRVHQKDQADIDSINKRGTNNSDSYGRKKKKESEDSGSDSTLGEDKLDKDDGLKDKDKDKGEGKDKKNVADKAVKAKDDSMLDKAKSLISLKTKIIFWAIVGALGLLLVAFCIMYLVMVWDSFATSISSYFGIKEANLGENTNKLNGLYTDKELQDLSWEELVEKLKKDDVCKINSPSADFGDKLYFLFNNGFKDSCQLIRVIRGTLDSYEEKYKDNNIVMDAGLVIGTIFYGYDESPKQSSFNYSEQEDVVPSNEHFKVLEDIVNKKDENGMYVLTKQTVIRIIKSQIFEELYPTFEYKLETEEDDEGNIKKVTASCEQTNHENYSLNLDKWQMFMRYNDDEQGNETGTENKFSVPGYMATQKSNVDKIAEIFGVKNGSKVLNRSKFGIEDDDKYLKLVGSGFVYDTNMSNSYTETGEECNGSVTREQIEQSLEQEYCAQSKAKNCQVVVEDTFDDAYHFYVDRNITDELDTNIYFQKVEDIHDKTKDEFESRDIPFTYLDESDNVKLTSQYVEFDYKNGFAYQNFPGYKYADESEKLPQYIYDEIFTPKEIETLIEEVLQRKDEFNEILFINPVYSTIDPKNGLIGSADPGNDLIGEYCEDYLTAELDSINVSLTDCAGRNIGTVSFKEYIMGVTYARIGYQSNKDYVLTQMISSISYALARENNYKKGTTINMKSGSCDRNWCSTSQGCYTKQTLHANGNNYDSTYPGTPAGETVYKNPMSSSQSSNYSSLYDTAKQYLIVDKSAGKVKSTDYTSSVESQAQEGTSFIDILKGQYGDDSLIECLTGSGSPTIGGGNGTPTNPDDGAVCKSYVSNYDPVFNTKVLTIANNYAQRKSYVGDCSTYVRKVLNDTYSALSINESESFTSTNMMIKYENKCVKKEDLKPGDLIFYATNPSRTNGIGHVSVFAGYSNGTMMVYETNTHSSCAVAKGSACDGKYKTGRDKTYYGTPVHHQISNGNKVAAYVRVYP